MIVAHDLVAHLGCYGVLGAPSPRLGWLGYNGVRLSRLACTVAAARIVSDDPSGFVALSNDVDYAVFGDGSATFMAPGEVGYYRLLGPSAP
jgi:hypothetical protein